MAIEKQEFFTTQKASDTMTILQVKRQTVTIIRAKRKKNREFQAAVLIP